MRNAVDPTAGGGGRAGCAGRAARAGGLLLASAFALLSSCATAGRPGARAVEPLSLLSPDALAYAELSGPALPRFAPLLAPEAQAASVSKVIARASSASLALLPADPAGGDLPFEAVLLGDYPRSSTRLALSLSKDFKKRGDGFVDEKAGLSVAVPRSGIVLAARGEVSALSSRLASGGSSPLPARYSGLAAPGREASPLLLYVPRPFERLGPSFLGEPLVPPVTGLLIAARALAEDPERYGLTVVFLFGSEADARVYKPVARLAWLGLARSLFPEAGPDFSSPSFEAEGSDLAAKSLEASASEIEEALRRIGSMGQIMRNQEGE